MWFCLIAFNSSMVRLKVESGAEGKDARNGFQFQYGTIKSSFSYPYPHLVGVFQFQYGTIKRW